MTKTIYILADPSTKMSDKFINFNLGAALKSGWLKEFTLELDQIEIEKD